MATADHGEAMIEVAKSVPVAAGAGLPAVTSIVTVLRVVLIACTIPPVMPVPVTGWPTATAGRVVKVKSYRLVTVALGVTAVHGVLGTTAHAGRLLPPDTETVPPPTSSGEVTGALLLWLPEDWATPLVPKSICRVPSRTIVLPT